MVKVKKELCREEFTLLSPLLCPIEGTMAEKSGVADHPPSTFTSTATTPPTTPPVQPSRRQIVTCSTVSHGGYTGRNSVAGVVNARRHHPAAGNPGEKRYPDGRVTGV
jgi:hypothetical protein